LYGSYNAPSPPQASGEQLVEPQGGAAGDDHVAAAVGEAARREFAYGAFDRVGVGEISRVTDDLTRKLLDRELDRVKGQELAQDGGFDGRVLCPRAAGFVPVSHHVTY